MAGIELEFQSSTEEALLLYTGWKDLTWETWG
jgi:hypothetical protein